LLDGSSATLADTPENQRVCPQSGAQRTGLGFPWLRFVVLLGLNQPEAPGWGISR